jgi:hypothetical protein
MIDTNLSNIADIATSSYKFKSKPFSLRDYPPMVDVYNSAFRFKKIMLFAGRQVSKSVTLAGLELLSMVLKPGTRSLYVSNLSIQTTRFSKLYLDDFLKSDIFHEYIKILIDNVHTKSFDNSSSIELSYLNEDATRTRGIPSDFNVYDEIQDINYDDIPIVRECLSASPPAFGFEIFAGTPKTMENTMEALWGQCTKLEWAMKCEYCEYWNIPDKDNAEKMIQRHGPSCGKCGKRINPRQGQWTEIEEGTEHDFIGFHLPQNIFPMHWEKYNHKKEHYIPGTLDTDLTSKWSILFNKKIKYPKIKFYNEVLGLSQDTGGRIITLSELKNLAKLPRMEDIRLDRYDVNRVACIDWGISAESSYTVIAILGHIGDVVHVLYVKKFHSTDILEILDEIIQILHKFKVGIVAADRGVGFTNNAILKEEYGAHKVVEFQYGAFKRLASWSKKAKCYMLDKTTSLDVTFMNMKSKRILFPPFEQMEEFFMHILAEYEEYLETPVRKYKVFRRNPSSPDDFLHTLNFGVMAMYKLLGISHLNMESIGLGGEMIDDI